MFGWTLLNLSMLEVRHNSIFLLRRPKQFLEVNYLFQNNAEVSQSCDLKLFNHILNNIDNKIIIVYSSNNFMLQQ